MIEDKVLSGKRTKLRDQYEALSDLDKKLFWGMVDAVDRILRN